MLSNRIQQIADIRKVSFRFINYLSVFISIKKYFYTGGCHLEINVWDLHFCRYKNPSLL
ncbi:hypothetical protein HMPREF0373_00289 [Eubacterium ramulus ATCC 29099]|uniref:Uncharacterized protein n=1 Tax=Eubacterium ramulus ATCC 29099 TaxID=1256908 RepID=U2Q6Z8_EUBRA|nr:hypothetical protein HMPREF0373_00289 [Eubacterium ramulus ATCC 29099]